LEGLRLTSFDGVGNSVPSLAVVPEFVGSQAKDAGWFASQYGLTPDGWQQAVLESWLAESSAGRWAAARCGLAVPRQNGKNALLEIRELYGMIELGEKFLHTAHEVKTARKAFLRLAGFFENRHWPELAGLAQSIRKTNGQEAIQLKNGGSVEFVARSKGSGRGFTVDVLVFDEAQDLNDEQLDALLPTISAAPTGNPQTLYTGTPPLPGSSAGVFARMRESAQAGDDGRMSWHEWSAGADTDIADRSVWYATNPGLGIRVSLDVIEAELAQQSEEGFLRERLGCWASSMSTSLIDPDVWAGLEDVASEVDGRFTFAVDMPPNRSHTTIVAAGHRSDGVPHVEKVALEPGTEWAARWFTEKPSRRKAEVAVDPSSPAGSLIPALEKHGITVLPVAGREFAQACGNFLDAVSEKRLRHLGQPELATAVDAARKRPLGDAWAWTRRDTSSDISPLVAATLALWILGKPPKRRPKSGKASFL
jgi:phage terminase large subunit-like protein